MNAGSSVSNRESVYAALGRRNRIVSKLRVWVPILGAIVLVSLLGQLIAANIANQFLPDGVRLENDNLVIDAPTYSGVMHDGTRYTVVSQNAQAAIDGPELIDLETARIDLTRPSGQHIIGRAAEAQFSLSAQTVFVDQILDVTESGGSVAQLRQTVFDLAAQSMDSGPVKMVFADGSVLTGATLHFDAESEEWDFTEVRLVVPGESNQ